MTRFASRSQTAIKRHPADQSSQEFFFCPEESLFYSQCLDRMVLNNCEDFATIVEFGSGEGSPVINSLLKHSFNGLINGYELNTEACQLARARIAYHHLSDRYVVHNASFFNQAWQSATYLIANPPYLPALDNDLYMPTLHGGTDGASITKQLLAMKCPSAMLMISAYSDPVGTIEYAIAQGYQVSDFITSPMRFGYYSSEPKVKQRIAELQQCQKAFYSENIYILAGVLFQKNYAATADLSTELMRIMTAL